MDTIHRVDKLYKKDSKGRIREWFGNVQQDDEGRVWVFTHAGLTGGSIRANSTEATESATMTALEVGESKLNSSFDSKLKNGYFRTVEDAEAFKPTKVMIIHKWEDHKRKMNYPCFVQPKLDGVCTKYSDNPTDPQFISREDNRFPKLDTKAKELSEYLRSVNLEGTMDSHGELYAHGHHVSEVIEAIKGDNPKVLAKLQYFVFDYMPEDCDDMWYINRLKVGNKFYKWDVELKPYVPIKTLIAHNEDEVVSHHETFIKQGFEGTVVSKHQGEGYLFDRRTYDKLKFKQVDSEEFEIVGTARESNDGDDLIMFKCKTKDGLTFKVRPAWNHERRKKAYAEILSGDVTFIGKQATVEYRGLTKYKVPFHPVLIATRDYE